MATPASRLKSVCSKSPIWMRGQAASTDAQAPPLPSSKPPRLEPDYEVIEFPGQKHSSTLQSKGYLPKKCDLCGSKLAELQCDSCSSQAFCLSCDVMYHRHPNRQAHVRKRYMQPSNTKCEVQPPLHPKSELMSIPTPPPRRNRTIASRMMNNNQLLQNPRSLATIQQGKKDGSFLGSLKRFVGSTRCLSPTSNTMRPDPKVGKNNHSWLKSHDQRSRSKDSGYLEWDAQSRERAGSCSINSNNNAPLFSPMAQAQSMAQLNCAGCYHQSNWDWNRSQMSLNALPMHSPWLGHCHGSTMMFPPPLPCHMPSHHPYNEAMQQQAFRQPSSRARSCKMDETGSEMSLFDGRYRRHMSEVGRHSPFSTRSRRTLASESDDDDRFSKKGARFAANSPRNHSPTSSRKGFSKATTSKIKNSKYVEQRANRRDGASSDSDDELTSERDQSKTSSDVRNEKYSDDSRRYESSNYGSVADSRNNDGNKEVAESRPINKLAKTILPDWECKHCTYLNHGDCKVCDICCKTSHLVAEIEEQMKKLNTALDEGGLESKGTQMNDKTDQKETDNKISKGTSPPPQSISTQTYEAASEITPKMRSSSFSNYEHWRAPNSSRNTNKSKYKVPASLKSDTDDSAGYSGLDIRHSPRSISTHNLRPASANSLRHSPVLPDYMNSLSKKQGLEVVKLLREAEKRQFSAEDLSVALTKCGETNPIEWLRQNWNKMIDTVVSVTSEMSTYQSDKPIGVISTFEARDALRLTDGDIWSAANLCAQQRRNKCSEIMRNGSFSCEEAMAALNANHGDVESAKMYLNNDNAKTFSMNIWEPPQNNDDNMSASVAECNGKITIKDQIKNLATNNLKQHSGINKEIDEIEPDQYKSNIINSSSGKNEHLKNMSDAKLPINDNANNEFEDKCVKVIQNGEREMTAKKENNPEKASMITTNENKANIREENQDSSNYNVVHVDANNLQELESLALLVDHNLDNLVIGINTLETYQAWDEALSKNMKYSCLGNDKSYSEMSLDKINENGFANVRNVSKNNESESEISLENDQVHSNVIFRNTVDNGLEADQFKSKISLENNECESGMREENKTDNTLENNEAVSKVSVGNASGQNMEDDQTMSNINLENVKDICKMKLDLSECKIRLENLKNDCLENSQLTSNDDLVDSSRETNKFNGLDKNQQRCDINFGKKRETESILQNYEPGSEHKRCFNDSENNKQSVREIILEDVQYIDASSDEESNASQKICSVAKNSSNKINSMCEKSCAQNKMPKKEVVSTNVSSIKKNYHANCVKSVNPDSWRYQRSKTTLNKCEANNIKKAFSTLELSKKRSSLKSTSSLDLTRGSGILANKSKIPKLANGKSNVSNKDLTVESKLKRNQIDKPTIKQSKLNPPKNPRLSVIKEHEKSEFLKYVVENLQKEIGLNKLLDSFISKKIGLNGKLEGKTSVNDVCSKTSDQKNNGDGSKTGDSNQKNNGDGSKTGDQKNNCEIYSETSDHKNNGEIGSKTKDQKNNREIGSETGVPKNNGEIDSEFDEIDIVEANKLLEEGSVASLQQAKLAVKLMSMNFDEPSSVDASNHCANIETALAYLQINCELCAGKFPIKRMISMLLCEHRCCVECCKKYFTLQISERNVSDCVCPFCKMPNIGRLSGDESVNYFSNLDVMLKTMVEPKIHEIFQTKLRDRTLAQDPNFRWCPKCSSGFIANPSQPQMQCPDCKSISCAKCSQSWTEKHNEMSCERYADWLREFGGDIRIEKHLEENGVVCPNCKTKFALVKGGCMHLTCTECKYEFCSDCCKPFAMGSKCSVSDYCVKLGLHAHHPRNCLFYLRDKDPKQLQNLLAKNNISFHKEKVEGQLKCDVTVQRETENGFVDTTCGTPIEFYNLCRKHYVEYASKLVTKFNVETLELLNADDLETLVKREGKSLPPRWYGMPLQQYYNSLLQIVQEQIPL